MRFESILFSTHGRTSHWRIGRLGYDEIFKRRMETKGNSLYDRRMMLKSRSFKHWFNNTLGRELVTIDGVEQYAVFQDQNMNNNKDLSDDKYIMVENESNLEVGSLVVWRKQNWLVFTEEYKTIPTHKQAKIKESNGFIKWLIDGKISGDGQGHPAYIQNQTLYTLGVSTSGNHSWIVNAKMTMYLPKNKETLSIPVGQRVVIGGMVFQVMFKDAVSREGLINYLLEEDFVNHDVDNIELGVANYYGNVKSDEEEPVSNDVMVSIIGDEKAKIGSTLNYRVEIIRDEKPSSEGLVEWTIADTEESVNVIEQTGDFIKIRVINNFQKVGSTVTLIGKTSDGVVASKTIRIISPY